MGKLAVISVLAIIASAATYAFSWIIFGLALLGFPFFPLANVINIASKGVFFLFFAFFMFDLFIVPKIIFHKKEKIKYEKTDHMKISVVMPAYNESLGIKNVVKDFLSQDRVKEVVVIDNGSSDNTGKLAREAGAKVLRVDPNCGFGFGCYLALKEAKEDIIVMIESDSTHNGADLKKLLPYLENVDMAVGTRTTAEFINPGAKMDWFLRWGNTFISKLLQIRFYNRARLTDAGCAFRAIKRPALDKIMPQMKIFDDSFSPYMIALCLKNNLKVVEIPVSYNKRMGESKSTGKSRLIAFKLGLKIIWRIATS